MTNVNAASGAGNPAAGTYGASAVDATSQAGALGKDTFLKLLVAQLKYQNPLQPTDPSQFLSQSAQFTMIEKLEEISKQGAARQAGSDVLAAGALIGRQVTYWDGAAERTGVVRSVRFASDAPPVVSLDDRDIPMSAIERLAAGPAAPA